MSKKFVAGILGCLLSMAAIVFLTTAKRPESMSFEAFNDAFIIPLSFMVVCAIGAFGCFAYIAKR